MSKLKELEKRLQVEPDNLGLRVMLATAMRDAGRQSEAVELYRSVAIVYRDQGRTQQAIAVCRSILELAPDDVRCHALLATLVAGKPEPAPDAAQRARTTSAALPARPSPTPRPSLATPPRAFAAVPAPPPPPRPPSAAAPPEPTELRTPPIIEVRAKTSDLLTPADDLPTLRPRAGASTAAPIPSILRPRPGAPPDPAVPEEVPARRSSFDETPLPKPLPYHVADPSTRSIERVADRDLPMAENAPTRPGSDEGSQASVAGIASAARRISASLIAASGNVDLSIVEARQYARVEPLDLDKLGQPPTVPIERIDLDDEAVTAPPLVPRDSEDAVTSPPAAPPRLGEDDAVIALSIARDADDDIVTGSPAALPPARDSEDDAVTAPPIAARGSSLDAADAIPMHRDSDDEQTRPRDLPGMMGEVARRRSPMPARQGALASAFFSPLPLERRADVLSRFHRRSLISGATVIRQGERNHALVLVASGRLEIRADRSDGKVVQLGAVGPGEYVGEAALLARLPSPAHVIALTDVELLMLQPRDFYEIAGAYPALWAELKDVAERRTREHEARLRR